jgi:hypothetical protein
MNAASLVGFRFFDRDHRGRFELRLSWAEVTGGAGFSLALCSFEDHFSLHVHLGWPNVFIALPFLKRWHREPDEGMEKWGLSFFESAIHLNWGNRCRIVHMPWAWEWVRTSHLLADGTWHDEIGRRRRESFPNYPLIRSDRRPHLGVYAVHDSMLWSETYPYRYVLRSGEVQEREATVTVAEMEHRWRWFKWLPLSRRVSRYIDIKFNGEVGERAGSWKGGCLGCSFTIRHDEMPREALARMEQQRKF